MFKWYLPTAPWPWQGGGNPQVIFWRQEDVVCEQDKVVWRCEKKYVLNWYFSDEIWLNSKSEKYILFPSVPEILLELVDFVSSMTKYDGKHLRQVKLTFCSVHINDKEDFHLIFNAKICRREKVVK